MSRTPTRMLDRAAKLLCEIRSQEFLSDIAWEVAPLRRWIKKTDAILVELGYVTRAQLETELESGASQPPEPPAICIERSPRDKSRCRRDAGHEGRHTSRNDGWYAPVEAADGKDVKSPL